MTIIDFVEHVIGDKSLSPAQRMALKAIYGLPLTAEELAIYQKTAGLSEYVPKERAEATFILGRRCGKSDKLASNIAIYEACAREHKLSVGETGVVMIVSSELKRQSRIVFNYCLAKLEGSKVLRRLIKRTTTDEIELTNGISIQVYPCNVARIRGASLVCFVGDEAAFWKNSEGKNIDVDVLNSARPGLSFPYSKMIKISSPWMMRGECWNDYQRYWGKPESEVLVLQGDIYTFRPDYSAKKLEAARRRDPVAFEQEWLARFRTDLSGMYDPAVIDRTVNPDRPMELAFRATKGFRAAFVDVAGGGGRDSYAIAIGRLEGEKVIVEVVRSRAPKFNPEDVTAQYAELLKTYHVFEVTGDKFSGDFASSLFEKSGINYQRAEKSKSELYVEGEGAFNAGLVDIPNKEPLVSQLKSLVRKARSGGRDSVDMDGGAPEDEANVVAGLIFTLQDRTRGGEPMIWRVGGPSTIDRRPAPVVSPEALLGLSEDALDAKLNSLTEKQLEELRGELEKGT
jgi:hypothetical protein